MRDILVSIIIPTFNRYNFLKKCFESLARQTCNKENFEIIIVDDGGIDKLEALIDNLAPYHLVKYLKQDSKGPAAARNLGIKNAKGEIIGFIDDDAVAQENWISNAIDLFKDSQIAAVEGKVVIDRAKITPFSHNIENLNGGLYCSCNMFYRKSVLEEVGGFDERFSFAFREDADLAFSIMERGYKIIFSPEVVVFHNTVSNIWEPFKQARRYCVDPFLYKKHPAFYYSKIDVYNFNGFKLIHPRRRSYLIYIILSFINLFIYLYLKNYFSTSLSFLTLAYLTILFGHLRLWKNRRIKMRDILLAMPIISIVPFIYYYCLIKGMIIFKSMLSW